MPKWPKCIHQWNAPENCPSCLAIYKQRRIEELEAELAEAVGLLRDSFDFVGSWDDANAFLAKQEVQDGD